MNIFKSDGFAVLVLIVVITLFYLLIGCSGTINTIRDKDFTVGCKVTEAEAKLGFFNQEGVGVVCKLKCSESLPKNFTYKYVNSRTGCSVEIKQ